MPRKRRGKKWQWGVWHLYSLYDSTGRALYHGITSRTVEQRLAEHAEDKPWWPWVDHTRTRSVVLNDGQPMFRYQAEREEKKIIQDPGGTLANSQHNRGRGTALNRRIQTGHPDPTLEHVVGTPPDIWWAFVAATHYGPVIGLAVTAAAITAVAVAAWLN